MNRGLLTCKWVCGSLARTHERSNLPLSSDKARKRIPYFCFVRVATSLEQRHTHQIGAKINQVRDLEALATARGIGSRLRRIRQASIDIALTYPDKLFLSAAI